MQMAFRGHTHDIPTRHTSRGLAVGLCLTLAACGGSYKGVTSNTGGKAFTRKAPERIVANGTDVTIAGPSGYCVDRAASRVEQGSSFVLLGNCASIARSNRAPQPRQTAVLSASVGEAQAGPGLAGQVGQLDAFFRSEQGRALIAKSGNAEDVEVLDTFVQDDTFYLRAKDSGSSAPELGQERWRAVTEVRSRLVSLSVMEAAGSPMSADAGLTLITEFASNVRQANVGAGEGVPAVAPVTTPTPMPAPAPVATPPPARVPAKKLNIGIIRRVFG